MNPIIKFFYWLRYREAVKLADKAYAAGNHRYFVIASSEPGCKLLVIDRKNFRALRAKKYISREASMRDVVDECFYATPCTGGSRPMSEVLKETKRKEFFAWVKNKRRYDREQKAKRKAKTQA